jgi:hypothetical protein
MRFPPVRPLPTMQPWSAPQTIEAVPEVRTMRPAIASGAVVQASTSTAVREAHRYAMINGSIVVETNANTSILVLAAPQNYRNFLLLRNASALGTILVDFGREASQFSPLSLAPGAVVLFDTVVPQDDVYALSTSVTPQLSVAFSNINFLGPVE